MVIFKIKFETRYYPSRQALWGALTPSQIPSTCNRASESIPYGSRHFFLFSILCLRALRVFLVNLGSKIDQTQVTNHTLEFQWSMATPKMYIIQEVHSHTLDPSVVHIVAHFLHFCTKHAHHRVKNPQWLGNNVEHSQNLIMTLTLSLSLSLSQFSFPLVV